MGVMEPSCTILPRCTAAIILSYPGNMASIELMQWLYYIGINPDNILSLPGRFSHRALAYNSAVAIALRTRNPRFLFCDNDIKPHPDTTAPLLSLMADVVSCQYRGEPSLEETWDVTDAFHCGLWACRRKVLETISPPWFEWSDTANGTAITECLCKGFRAKVLEAGFSIQWGGFAEHQPKG